MKIIRNNVCYVEIDDILFLGSIPSNIVYKLKIYCSKNIKFQKFTKKEAVEFFENQKYILDYNLISTLSDEHLDYIIKDLKRRLNEINSKFDNSSDNIKIKLNKEYDELINNLKYMLQTLEKYRNNRNRYDKEINEIFSKKQKRL